MRPARLAADRGQSAVEVAALAPLVLVVALGAGQWLAAGSAGELARHAAEAGAVALLEGADPVAAARAAAPGAGPGRLAVRVRGRRVSVTLRPQTILPGLSSVLTAHASAAAGPS